MHKFVRSLLTEWRRLELPASGETIVVAVSGGADSVSLLLALADLARRAKITNDLVVAHFDHRLRGDESRQDADFVKRLADRCGFRFAFGEAAGNFAFNLKGNLEQNARRARYRFLASVREEQSAYAAVTAHTIDDQAETFLINLLRGSGPTGLRAMRAVNVQFKCDDDISPMRLVRPMIGWATRSDTVDFCGSQQIEFRIDAMNSDRRFTRVRVREELIPLLATFNPSIVSVISRTAAMMPAPEPSATETELRIADLEETPDEMRAEVLRAWIKRERGGLRGVGAKHIDAILRLISSRKSGRVVELPGRTQVVRGGGKLRFIVRGAE